MMLRLGLGAPPISVRAARSFPPIGDIPGGTVIEDTPTNWPVPVTAEIVGEQIIFHGKKSAGAAGKFLYNVGAPQLGYSYIMKYEPDWSRLANAGVSAMIGFCLKDGNTFHIVGLKGDGAGGVDVYQVSGSGTNGWNKTSGHDTTDNGAASNGTKDGPNWIQIYFDPGGTYSFYSSADGETWSEELSGQTPMPFSSIAQATQFGPAAWLQSDDNGLFDISWSVWTIGIEAPSTFTFQGALVNLASDANGNYNNTKIAWGAETFDTDGFHDNAVNNTRITIPAAIDGKYVIIRANVYLTTVNNFAYATLALMKNNSLTFDGTAALQAYNYDHATCSLSIVSPPILVATGDYFEANLTSNDTNITLMAAACNFSIEVLG